MPEFVVVISNPKVKDPRVVPVRVVGVEDLEFDEKHKEQRVLPIVKVHPQIIELLKPPLGIVTVRIWKNKAAKEKVSLVAKASVDESIDVMTVGVPLAFLTEKIGARQVLGEIFPTPTFQIRVPDNVASKLVGLKIGDKIDGRLLGLPNITLEIRGGSDLAGFPMRLDVEGAAKKYLLLSSGQGFKPKKKGERRRKLVRGNTISSEIVQINTVIIA